MLTISLLLYRSIIRKPSWSLQQIYLDRRENVQRFLAAHFVCARSVVFCQNFWQMTQRLPGNWRGDGKRFSGAFRAGAPTPFACLLLARPFFLVPTTSKRLLRRLPSVFLDNWLNFRVRGQFEIKILIAWGHCDINITYFIWIFKRINLSLLSFEN